MISNYLLLWLLVTTEVIRLTVTFFNEVSDLISSIRAEASLRAVKVIWSDGVGFVYTAQVGNWYKARMAYGLPE
eukprot:s75_g23.t1